MTATMRAITQRGYGPFEEVLQLDTVDRPLPGDGMALVRVHAASIHIGDVYGMQGVPYLFRPMYGLRRPREPVAGTDIAGTVEAIGPGVTRFQPGDAVFGWCSGAFAEYAVASERALETKPADLTFEEAAAIGVSAMTALQALRDHLQVGPGQHLLVNGASGGVGTYAVQIAKALGSEVTGVCGTGNLDLVRSIGADHVIDYTVEDFTRGGPRYDRILDNVGNHSKSATRRALKPDGLLLSNGSPVGGWVGGVSNVISAALFSLLVRQQARPFVSMPTLEDLSILREMAEDRRIRPVIDRTYPLAEAAQALTYVAQGRTRGTAVITMEQAR
jgi:NADPH:quinone reductase-like Zn-dependent oxidoreductase